MTLDNLDLLKSDDASLNAEEKTEPKTSLEFEISEEAPATERGPIFTVDADITPKRPEIKVEVLSSHKDEKVEQPKEEFSVPDSFEVNEKYNTQSFVETPAAIRPTYLPRFTEVSDTYRMQNDPRPRPKPEPKKEKAESKDDATAELDPTAEGVDDKAVEKVVVTSAVIKNPEPTDETLTVLKFSTPIEFETQDASEPSTPEVEAVSEPTPEPIPEPVIEEIPEPEVIEEPVAESVEEVEEKPKNMTIPDPDATFSVVDFSPREISVTEEPLGASEPEKKEKHSSHSEFNSPIQRDAIKDRFLDTLMSIRVRLGGVVILLLAMIVLDCFRYFGINLLSAVGLGSVPAAGAIVDMQFSVCIFLFTIPEMLKSFRMLLKGKFTPELINVFSLIVLVVNDLVIFANSANNYLTFGVLYGIQCFATVIAAYNRTQSDFTSFKLVSRNVAKNVLDKRLTRELPRENLALDGAIDEYNSKTARMFRTVFVSNFFKRSSESCENFVNAGMMMGISAGVALVTGVVSFFLDGYSPVSGVQSLAMVFMLSFPIFSILSHKLPYKHATSRAGAEESAFVGESSIYEGADVDVFTYEDTEIFGIEDVSIRKVHLYGKAYNTPKAMKQMYALFSVIGGPLDFVFSSALDRKCPPADDIIIEDNGVSGIMDGHRIAAGTEEYMISHGIAIPEDDYRTNISSTDSTKIMYGAEDGEVYVKFFIRYSFSEEFTMLLPELKDKKIVPLIYTRDPNITGDLLKVLTLGEDLIRVMKKYVPRTAEEKTYRRIDSGIVTHGDKSSAINMVLLAKKYASFQSSLAATELISMIVGAVLAAVLAIGDMFVLPATLLALWQVVWCAVLYVRSKLTFQRRREREENTEE